MIKRKYMFGIATIMNGSEVEREVELEFDGDMTEAKIEELVNGEYADWLNQHNYGGYYRVK